MIKGFSSGIPERFHSPVRPLHNPDTQRLLGPTTMLPMIHT